MPSLKDQLLIFMNNYKQAKTETFKEHELGTLIRREIPKKFYRKSQLNRKKYLIKGSVGQGNWAHVPWIAVMNREITTSTQRGFYLVYLFAEDMSHVYLALAQGVTETPPAEMDRINKEIREELDIKEPQIHRDNNFYLGESRFAVDYKKSTAIYIPYLIDGFPSDEQLLEDLRIMVKYYEEYIKKSIQFDLPKTLDKFLSELISLHSSETYSTEIYGEIKASLVEILNKQEIDRTKITFNSREILDRIPFVSVKETTYELTEYTTLDLPNASYQHTIQMLEDLLGGDQTSSISRSVSWRALNALNILNYIDRNENLFVTEVPNALEQSKRVSSIPIIKMIIQLLESASEWTEIETKQLIKDVLRSTIVSSKDGTQIKESVLDKRYNYVIDWLKTVGIVDEDLQVIDQEIVDAYQKDESIEAVKEANELASEKELIEHIYTYVRSKGFNYTIEEITNLYLSLRAKPFVILSGISGTGKTKMVQWFAESVGADEDNGQFTLIPIRPDWNDGSDLLGYVDIKGDFKEGSLTKVIKIATNNPDYPYFVLLDEMNLARVEHYFSDILSVMESRTWKDGQVVSSNLLTKETVGFDLSLPNNLYVIGTVNMDETTYPFSKKVLDRANTIEFNRVELDNLAFLHETNTAAPLRIDNEKLKPKYLHLKDAYAEHEDLIKEVTNELVQINTILEKNNAHVGYRVRDEICFYMIYNDEANLLSFETAFDHCVLQKILPRISGSDSLVEQLLRELYEMFTNTRLDEGVEIEEVDIATAKYPQSAKKVAEMLRRLRDGYTSFWIS
ncbi:DUF3578 domain-containing protein [Oceanobacillus luteolus]|uniref:MrcB family domain-containing protein n=1 Tax=Oceanobacillus luteolus TaxID=1274358 RepID=A0ABW4HSP2_9BACI|nr:DUF3578 domain-containing protein [Oceanobacillus luteolus]MCM3740367.1 DUF3578 domain-containing protein [Oceanobacillus luteolus]